MTQGEVKSIQQSKQYKNFVASGDADKSERLVLHGYILTSMGIYMVEEANDLMRKHGLFQHGLKHTANDFSRAFDQHSRVMQSFFPGIPEKMTFLKAIDKVRPAIDELVTTGVLQAVADGGEEDSQQPNSDAGEPGCSAANNDQIAYGNIPDNDKC